MSTSSFTPSEYSDASFSPMSFSPMSSNSSSLVNFDYTRHETPSKQEQTSPKKKKVYRNQFLSPLTIAPEILIPQFDPSAPAYTQVDPEQPKTKRVCSGSGVLKFEHLPDDREGRLACLEVFTKDFDVSKGFGNITAKKGNKKAEQEISKEMEEYYLSELMGTSELMQYE